MDIETVERMRLFGEKVGIAFQIKDDLFDYTSNNSIGKPSGNDIKEKKLTLPLIHSLQQAGKSDRKHILKLINNKIQKDSIEKIIAFVKDKRGDKYAIEMMEKYKKDAILLLKDFPENDSKNSLKQLVEFTTTRKK